MSREKILNANIVLNQTSKLEYIKLEDDLYVFRYTHSINMDKLSASMGFNPTIPSISKKSGFIDEKNLEKLKRDKKWEYKTLNNSRFVDGRDHFFMFMLPEGRDFIQKNGHHGIEYTWDKIKKFISDKDPYETFKQGEATLNDVAIFSNYSDQFFDRKGNPLPTSINLICLDRQYDLEKALEHLGERDDIRIENPKNPIKSIEMYDYVQPKPKGFKYIWRPHKDDYQRMWNEFMDENGEDMGVDEDEAIFNLDILGLRESGAALFDDYYQKVEEPEDESDPYDY